MFFRYLSILFVCLASIAFEIFLAKYFAVINWSEYGYWVISIAMVGYAFSGVVIHLFKDFFEKHSDSLFFWLPTAMMFLGTSGFHFLNLIPFNPLELQNEVLWAGQLVNIGKYYLSLFPFFFASGLFVGLSFTVFKEHIPMVYTVDLVGAGIGALVILGAMFFVHPYYLPATVPPMLFIGALSALSGVPSDKRKIFAAAGTIILVACQYWLLNGEFPGFSQYKPVSAALNVENNRKVDELFSPRGYYLVLDNYIERYDPALSNNYELLGADGPPSALGLYRDGERLSSLPRDFDFDSAYLKADLGSLPYLLIKPRSVLLIGSGGGFRIHDALRLGAEKVRAVESDPNVFAWTNQRLRMLPESSGRAKLILTSPAALIGNGEKSFDLIDVGREFPDLGQANKYVLTVEGAGELIGALAPNGVLSVSVNIGELPVYALKLVNTVKEALSRLGEQNPASRIMVYRSSWICTVLVGQRPFNATEIGKMREFCLERSFDTPYFPGIEPARIEVWNDLPAVSFEDETRISSDEKANDSLMEDIYAFLTLNRKDSSSWTFFNLEPSTYNRPFFHEILSLSSIASILKRVEIIPRQEIGYLVNVAVLIQSIVFALFVLIAPLFKKTSAVRNQCREAFRGATYFLCLGLGYLFVEIALIDRFTFFLNDSVTSFAVVLSLMLIFSGIGSAFADKLMNASGKGAGRAAVIAAILGGIYALALSNALISCMNWSQPLKFVLIALIVAPAAFFMGMPFPLGLSVYKNGRESFVPWAWSINGAFSVIATPAANIIAVTHGYRAVFLTAAILYLVASLVHPKDECVC